MPAVARQDPPFRAEHVGSLLRPQALKEAHRALGEGTLDAAGYAEILEREIARVIAMQEAVGLQAVSDGELRRSSWFGFFFEALDGFRLDKSLFAFHDGHGHGHDYEWMTCVAAAPIRRSRGICTEEFRKVAARTDRLAKVTMPSPSALHFFRGDACADAEAYPDLEAFWQDVIAVYQAEIRELAAMGCRYLQFDEVPLAMLCDGNVRAQVAAQGLDPEALVARYLGVLNEILAVRPPEMTVAMHLCRGNFRSRWMAAGGYEPVAERLFGEAGVDAFFLEYDTERAGDFSPLRLMPSDKRVVLGLVSTKTPDLEDRDGLRRRIDEASRLVPLERLALSPQCGFASVAGGNLLSEEDQRRKLALVSETARAVWG